jgi:hypothetical protein
MKLKQNKNILICEWLNYCVLKVPVFNKNDSNVTEEVTTILSDVITLSKIKIIKSGNIAWGICHLTIPPQTLYHKYYGDLKVRPSLPNFPSSNVLSTVARNKSCAPVKWWEHH